MTREEAIKNIKEHCYFANLIPRAKEALEMAIKALEQEYCEDAIRRQAVLDEISDYNNDLDYTTNELYDRIKRMSSVNPQPMTGWIPVSERLPEDIRPVIVTWKNNDPKSYYQYIVGKHFIGTAHYKNGTWFWYSSTTEDMLAEYGRCDSEEFDEAIEVIAWMPLPKPYVTDINIGKMAESEDKE